MSLHHTAWKLTFLFKSQLIQLKPPGAKRLRTRLIKIFAEPRLFRTCSLIFCWPTSGQNFHSKTYQFQTFFKTSFTKPEQFRRSVATPKAVRGGTQPSAVQGAGSARGGDCTETAADSAGASREPSGNRAETAQEPRTNSAGTANAGIFLAPQGDCVGTAREQCGNHAGAAQEPRGSCVGIAQESRGNSARNCAGSAQGTARTQRGTAQEPRGSCVGTARESRGSCVGTARESRGNSARNCSGSAQGTARSQRGTV